MISRTPLPSGVELSWDERLYRSVSAQLSDDSQALLREVLQSIDSFLNEYAILLFLGGVGILCVFIGYGILYREQKRILKIWSLILFFLAKRHMILPLLYTVSVRNNILSHADRNTLLDIRLLVQNHSFSRHPEKRIIIEQDVSRIVMDFFTRAEKNSNASQKELIHHLLDDFTFLDEKLYTLQQFYNQEAFRWNTYFKKPFLRPFFRIVGLRPLELFIS